MDFGKELKLGLAVLGATTAAALGGLAVGYSAGETSDYSKLKGTLPECALLDEVASNPQFTRDQYVEAARLKDGSMGNGSCVENSGEIREVGGGIG